MDQKSKENQGVDFLSRLNTKGENVLVFDDFPDEHLFYISTHTPWFEDIANYLDTSRFPQHMSSKEKQKIIRLSTNYSWMEGDLYQTGPNLIVRRCVWDDKMHDILKEIHDVPCGGHLFH